MEYSKNQIDELSNIKNEYNHVNILNDAGFITFMENNSDSSTLFIEVCISEWKRNSLFKELSSALYQEQGYLSRKIDKLNSFELPFGVGVGWNKKENNKNLIKKYTTKILDEKKI